MERNHIFAIRAMRLLRRWRRELAPLVVDGKMIGEPVTNDIAQYA